MYVHINCMVHLSDDSHSAYMKILSLCPNCLHGDINCNIRVVSVEAVLQSLAICSVDLLRQ